MDDTDYVYAVSGSVASEMNISLPKKIRIYLGTYTPEKVFIICTVGEWMMNDIQTRRLRVEEALEDHFQIHLGEHITNSDEVKELCIQQWLEYRRTLAEVDTQTVG